MTTAFQIGRRLEKLSYIFPDWQRSRKKLSYSIPDWQRTRKTVVAIQLELHILPQG